MNFAESESSEMPQRRVLSVSLIFLKSNTYPHDPALRATSPHRREHISAVKQRFVRRDEGDAVDLLHANNWARTRRTLPNRTSRDPKQAQACRPSRKENPMQARLSLRQLASMSDRFADQAERTAERYRRHPTEQNPVLAQVWHATAGRTGQPWTYFSPAGRRDRDQHATS